ncbi:MAG: hypothetical protein ACWGQW_20075 [bacterium]
MMANNQGKAYDWTNNDGLVAVYGPRTSANTRGGKLNTRGTIQELKINFTYDDLPGSSVADSGSPSIPADAVILGGYLMVNTAFADTTGLTIGLNNLAGSAIDADGLLETVAAVALTADTKLAFDGDLVGTTIGAAIGYPVVADASSNSTAGSGTIVIEYLIRETT